MATRLAVVEGLNGQAKRRPVRKPAGRSGRARRWITVGMGCGVACLSLALSSIGGQLVQEGRLYLGGAVLGICCTVLAVSLSHLAWAIRDITRSAVWQSWCLAVAVDVSLVACELACIA